MHTGKRYSLLEFLAWTRRDIYLLLLIGTIPTLLYVLAGWHWIAIPWVPIALIGTAAAFVIGFKNTQTYNRLWEARQIWGAIVNTSRSWGMLSRDYISADASTAENLMLRHCAWLTALRYQLREPRAWENGDLPHFREYRLKYSVPEWEIPFEAELKKYLSSQDFDYVMGKKNKAAQLIAMQSDALTAFKKNGSLGAYEYVHLSRVLSELYEQQGKCERIKNFPYPRQFASISLFFVWLFVVMMPLGMINEFAKIHPQCVWFAIPFSTIVSWVFVTMDRVGEATENPFEGGANDIPMAAMSRTIEIDLRDMLDQKDLPAVLQPKNNILM